MGQMYNPTTGAQIDTGNQGTDLTSYYQKAGYVVGTPPPIIPPAPTIPQGGAGGSGGGNYVGADGNTYSSTGQLLSMGAPAAATTGAPSPITLADVKAKLDAVGQISSTDAATMRNEATQQVSGQFDPLINSAVEAARQGNAAATVRAGQRGGFESTQVAGAAALAPTVGGTFTGTGGSLEKTASAYDLNIQNLKIQKEAAIQEAYKALQKAKLDGQTADFDRAEKMFKLAQESDKQVIDLQIAKQDLKTKTQDYTIKQTSDLATKTAQTILPYLSGDSATDAPIISKYAKDNGIDPGALNAAVRKAYDEQSFYKSSDLIAAANKLPAGRTQDYKDPNTGRVFTITGEANPDTFTSTDDKGVVSIIDKTTGKIISQTAPGVGKTKTEPNNISVNFPRQDQNVLYDSSGKQVGSAWSNPITASTEYKDMAGNPISAADVQKNKYTTAKPSSDDTMTMVNTIVEGLSKIKPTTTTNP